MKRPNIILKRFARKTVYDAQKALDDLNKGKKPEKVSKKLIKKSEHIERELLELFKQGDKILTKFLTDIDLTDEFITECLESASIEFVQSIIDQVDMEKLKESEELPKNESLVLDMYNRGLLSSEDVHRMHKKHSMSNNFLLSVFETLDKDKLKRLVSSGIDFAYISADLFNNMFVTFEEFQKLVSK